MTSAITLLTLLLACGDKDSDDTGTTSDGGAQDGGAEDGGAQDGGAQDGGAGDGGTTGDGGGGDSGGGGGGDGGGDGGGGDGGGDGGGGDGGDGGTTDPDGELFEGVEDPSGLAWTEGPVAPDCTPHAGSGDLVALSGVLLLPEGPQAGVVVYDRAEGEITCVGADCDTDEAELVCTGGIISAGLIDTHNHLQYNVIPPWQHDELYADRYDWRGDDDYWDYREAYDAIEGDYECEIMRWAELRVLVGGGTSAVGSAGDDCIVGLVRNLDESPDEHGLEDYWLEYSSSTVSDVYDEADAAAFREELASGYTSAVENHVAEGVGGGSRDEIEHMFDIGMAGPGMIWVHSTDATVQDLARLAVEGGGIAWSPRSNLDLYAETTLADVALRLGVPVALGPDWTWSGSMSPAHEGSCAVDYLSSRGNPLADATLHAMLTHDAAVLLGLEAHVGTLEPGLRADISVFGWSQWPYRAVLRGGAESVRLVVVDGQALYGATDLVDAARGGDTDACEHAVACDRARTLCATSASSGEASMTMDELEAALAAALGGTSMPSELAYAGTLHGLWACEEDAYASCDLSSPAAGDRDGDGQPDVADLCPDAWEARQGDYDDDGVGDACDPCPLMPGVEGCAHDPTDIDDDGWSNDDDGCPYDWDPDQADRDGDDKNDACDLCPDTANPGDAPCPYSVAAVRNPDDPLHPDEGSVVELSGMVVTAVRSGAGVYIQDPTLTEWAGIYVHAGEETGLSRGDVVTVSGTYTEYYDLGELTDPSFEVTGTAEVPDPVELDPCDVGTGGALAEIYESMLVSFEDVTVTDANPDAPDDYNEYELDGCLRVDDQMYAYADQPAAGTTYSTVRGVMTWTYSNSKVLPRDADDVEE